MLSVLKGWSFRWGFLQSENWLQLRKAHSLIHSTTNQQTPPCNQEGLRADRVEPGECLVSDLFRSLNREGCVLPSTMWGAGESSGTPGCPLSAAACPPCRKDFSSLEVPRPFLAPRGLSLCVWVPLCPVSSWAAALWVSGLMVTSLNNENTCQGGHWLTRARASGQG